MPRDIVIVPYARNKLPADFLFVQRGNLRQKIVRYAISLDINLLLNNYTNKSFI